MRRLDLVLVIAIALPEAAASETTSACGKLADVPLPRVEFHSLPRATPLRRTHSLLQLFSEGDGRLTEAAKRSDSAPLPWQVAPGREKHVQLVTWQDRERGNDENMPAIVLEPEESWCTSPLELPEGARLRFEAVATGEAGKLEIEGESGKPLFAAEILPAESLRASRQTDLEIGGGLRSLCFRVSRRAVAIGEPRLLAPETTSDPRPRWLVLNIVDALRGDLLRRHDARDVLPGLSLLAEGGHHYLKAISPGCHTRASVWPILMGRDLMRIDPLQRRQSLPIQSPLEAVYSRANLFVSHFAEAAGYHSVFLGNNAYLRAVPAFSRYSSWGRTDTGTLDTLERLPDLFARYADERLLLVYYVSTPHAQSETPRRLYAELRCSERKGVDECQCGYEARVRHADEAIQALQSGLDAYSLAGEVLQITTADHGEVFGDGMKLEGEIPSFTTGERRGAFASFDRGHGYACHEQESDVPIVVHGKGVSPARWEEAVSGLDVLPTFLDVMGIAPPGKLDGLPLSRRDPRRAIVSVGFCSDSRHEGGEQFLWWVEGCRVRDLDGNPLDHRGEVWRDGHRVATERTEPGRVAKLMARHEAWLQERLPSEALVFGVERVEEATVRIEVENGRIVDYGPSGSIYGLDRIEILGLSEDGSRIAIRFRGYRGLYHVTTLPPRAKVRIQVVDHPEVVTFVGRLQLPLPVSDRIVDPVAAASFLLTDRPPLARTRSGPALRFWWQGYRASGDGAPSPELSDFDRVLREWGYIR